MKDNSLMPPLKNKALKKIDGSTGDGSGQIIRTALSLSMLTGIAIKLPIYVRYIANPSSCVKIVDSEFTARVASDHATTQAWLIKQL